MPLLIIIVIAVVVVGGGAYYFYKTFHHTDSEKSIKGISDANAAYLVMQLPEVKRYYSLFTGPNNTSPKTGGRAVTTLDGTEGNAFIIWIYEDIPARGKEPGHAVTFERYKVDKDTKEIQKL